MNTSVEYMQRAIRLAEKGIYTTDPNPAVGCVIVKNRQIVGEGWHRRAGEEHAEIHALNQAGSNAQGATVYVTLEPCSHTGKTPPCADALVKAGVQKVVIAMQDPNPQVAGNGIRKLHAAGIATDTGLLENQARALNPGFIRRMECGRPFVRVKLAMSLDGRTAMASGESQWISGEASRRDVHRLRAQSSAILTGIGTVLADDPLMDVRLSAEQLGIEPELYADMQPARIVLDSHFRMPVDACIVGRDSKCTLYTTVYVDKDRQYPFSIETLAASDGRIRLEDLMQDLASKAVNLLHVEAGSELCGALLQQHLVDEIIIYMAPHIMGDDARGLFHLPGLKQMKDRIALRITDLRAIGDDIRIVVSPEYKSCRPEPGQ